MKYLKFTLILFFSAHTVNALEIDDQKVIGEHGELLINTSRFLDAALAPDGESVAVLSDDGVYIWSLRSDLPRIADIFEDMENFNAININTIDIAFSPNGNRILVHNSEYMAFFDLSNQSMINDFSFEQNIKTAQFVNNNEVLIGLDTQIQHRDILSGNILTTISTSEFFSSSESVNELKVSPRGDSFLVTFQNSPKVFLLDVESGRPTISFNAVQPPIATAFSQNGNTIFLSQANGIITQRNTDTGVNLQNFSAGISDDRTFQEPLRYLVWVEGMGLGSWNSSLPPIR